jgi:hypothetical protein
MEKIKICLIVIVGLVLLSPVVAAADTLEIIDQTWVQGYYQGKPSADQGYGWAWQDIIATTPAAWDISKVDVTWANGSVTMQIFTNYGPGGVTESGVNAGQADIALRINGSTTWDYGISLAGIAADNLSVSTHLVKVTKWLDSGSSSLGWSTGAWTYAGAYGDSLDTLLTPIPTRIDVAGDIMGNATVTYVLLEDGTYRVDITFPFIVGFDSFDFLVKSGTCGNETMMGTATSFGVVPVPLPPSALLLGTGLLGLLGLGWRRRRQSS